jgi:hypothetical protein
VIYKPLYGTIIKKEISVILIFFLVFFLAALVNAFYSLYARQDVLRTSATLGWLTTAAALAWACYLYIS